MALCPSCGVAVTYDELQSRWCPACHAPLEDESARQRPRSLLAEFHGDVVSLHPEDRPAWSAVRTGLGLQAAFWVSLWICAAGLMAALRMSRVYREQSAPFEMLGLLMQGALAWSLFLLPTGYALCLAVPAASRCRGWMFASTACLALFAGAMSAALSMSRSNNAYVAKRAVQLGESGTPVEADSWDFRPEDWTGELLWPVNAVLGTIVAASAFWLFGGLFYAGFLASLARFLGRRKLSLAAGILFALPFLSQVVSLGIAWSLLVAEGTGVSTDFETASALGGLERGDVDATAVVGGLALVFGFCLSMAYAWILGSMRSNLTHLLRGERLLHGRVVR